MAVYLQLKLLMMTECLVSSGLHGEAGDAEGTGVCGVILEDDLMGMMRKAIVTEVLLALRGGGRESHSAGGVAVTAQ